MASVPAPDELPNSPAKEQTTRVSENEDSDSDSDTEDENGFWVQTLDACQEPGKWTKHEVNTLREYLSDYANDPDRWARLLWTTREDEASLKYLQERVINLFVAIFKGIYRGHVQIVDLIIAIGGMDPEDMGWTEEQKTRFPTWRDWTDVDDVFIRILRAYQKGCWEDRFGRPFEHVTTSISRASNICKFFALWSVRYRSWGDLCYGCFLIREGLELDPPGEDGDDTSTPEKLALVLDAEITVAAPYLRHASSYIYGCQFWPELEEKLFPVLNNQGKEWHTRSLWRGSQGFSKERWEFWKERLRTIQANPLLNEITRLYIKESLEFMESAEAEVDAKGKTIYDTDSGED